MHPSSTGRRELADTGSPPDGLISFQSPLGLLRRRRWPTSPAAGCPKRLLAASRPYIENSDRVEPFPTPFEKVPITRRRVRGGRREMFTTAKARPASSTSRRPTFAEHLRKAESRVLRNLQSYSPCAHEASGRGARGRSRPDQPNPLGSGRFRGKSGLSRRRWAGPVHCGCRAIPRCMLRTPRKAGEAIGSELSCWQTPAEPGVDVQ